MLNLTSKTGTAQARQEIVFRYISDFRNFANLLPSEKLQDTEITENSIRFRLSGLGEVGLTVAEQHPYHQLVIKAIEGTAADFTFWINIEEMPSDTSKVNVLLHANLNMFIEMMAKSPLQQFLDLMIDKVEEIKFEE